MLQQRQLLSPLPASIRWKNGLMPAHAASQLATLVPAPIQSVAEAHSIPGNITVLCACTALAPSARTARTRIVIVIVIVISSPRTKTLPERSTGNCAQMRAKTIRPRSRYTVLRCVGYKAAGPVLDAPAPRESPRARELSCAAQGGRNRARGGQHAAGWKEGLTCP